MINASTAKKLFTAILTTIVAAYLFGFGRPVFDDTASATNETAAYNLEHPSYLDNEELSREEIEARATDTNIYGEMLRQMDEGQASAIENVATDKPAAANDESDFAPTHEQTPLADYAWTDWSASASPNYIRVAGPAVERYAITEDMGVVYGNLDNLGRATYAADIITAKDRADAKARGRQSLGSIKLAGWQSGKTTIQFPDTGKSYSGDFYNRSHMLADSLGGDPVKENLVVGTRTQNVGKNDGKGGMAYTEELARNYLDRGGEWIYYSATPVYEGDEVIPRSVFVDMKSDDGSLDMHVEVYNTAYGHDIDYATGRWS